MAGWTWMSFTGWLVAGLGLAFVLLWLFGRRLLVRRTPRCVGCGYRLDGLEPGTCPECGRAAKRPGEAFALGRRRWIGVTGAGLLTLGLLLPTVPTARAEGWSAAFPLWVQTRLAPRVDDQRLWLRVASAATEGNLSEDATDRLRGQVLERMLDADADATPVLLAFSRIMHQRSNTRLEPYSQTELLRVYANGSPVARAHVASVLQDPLPPEAEEIQLRREAWANATGSERQRLIKWFVLYPMDEADIEIVRSAFEADPWVAAISVQNVVKHSHASIHTLLLDLFKHPSPAVRRGAVTAVERWVGERDQKPPLLMQREVLSLLLNDPDTGVVYAAGRCVEDVSEALGPEVGEAIAATTDDQRFRQLLSGARRKDDPGVLPGLERAAMQSDRSFPQRLDAASAYLYIHSRTRQESDPPTFASLYLDAIDRLVDGDLDAVIELGRDSVFISSPQTVVAVAERAAAAGVSVGGLNEWLESSPCLTAMLRFRAKDSVSPGEAFHSMLLSAMMRDPDHEMLQAVRARWFPESPSEQSPLETDG